MKFRIRGMQFFLRNTGFFGVLPDHLFDINPSWCEWLHSLVKKGHRFRSRQTLCQEGVHFLPGGRGSQNFK
ncbi:unnamed protein product [Timema podura]|uniref:Uncharacterized protein n=1 Tax=Timema podura TaxID=61482 RepID=A0ABN7NGY2_TIMPD|nr:unnamed protein product [Timema podura]